MIVLLSQVENWNIPLTPRRPACAELARPGALLQAVPACKGTARALFFRFMEPSDHVVPNCYIESREREGSSDTGSRGTWVAPTIEHDR
jgi:hypothetical protein